MQVRVNYIFITHTWTIGSDLASRLSPSTSFGRSDGFLASTATRTTGLTLNFIT